MILTTPAGGARAGRGRQLWRRAAALAVAACCALASAPAGRGAARETAKQEGAPLDRMIELNRRGEWGRAARLARSFLDAAGRRPRAARCQAYWSLAYSQVRLGRGADARATLAGYDRECQNLPAGLWIAAEVASLRKELDAPPATPAPSRDDGFWQRADPAALGMNPGALKAHAELCVRTGADAWLVVRKGKIVQEGYSADYGVPMHAMSSTKSVTGLLVGMLVDDGRIESVDEPVCAYLPDWCEGRRGQVTLRHLLTMTSGLPAMTETGVGYVNDKNSYVRGLAPADEPGTKWAYSNEGVQLLSPVLDRAAGVPVQDYARARLFEPLGMLETRLKLDGEKHAWTYADMETTARDFARLGLLMLGKGAWRGKRIVSEAWVERSTTRSQEFNPKYGWLWWLSGTPRGYAALGYLDTNLYVFPAEELIVVRMQSKPRGRYSSYEPEALELFARFTRP